MRVLFGLRRRWEPVHCGSGILVAMGLRPHEPIEVDEPIRILDFDESSSESGDNGDDFDPDSPGPVDSGDSFFPLHYENITWSASSWRTCSFRLWNFGGSRTATA